MPAHNPRRPPLGAAPDQEMVRAESTQRHPRSRSSGRGAPATGVAPAGRAAAPVSDNVSGCYRGRQGSKDLELRVDVDGSRPTNVISGDFFDVVGVDPQYDESFWVAALTITRTGTEIHISGQAQCSRSTPHQIQVTIPLASASPRAAMVAWGPVGTPATTSWVCPFISPYFRTVEIEEDSMVGVTPFTSYDTSSQPSGGSARVLSIRAAYERRVLK